MWCKEDAKANEGLNCYEGLYFLHLVIGILGMCMCASFVLIFTFFFIEIKYKYIDIYSPHRVFPMKGLPSDVSFLRMSMKVYLPFLITFDSAGTLDKELISVMAVGYLALLTLRYKTPPMYNKFM